MKECPKCGSGNVKVVKVGSSEFLVCENCGYDESEHVLEVYPEEKSSQKAKSRHSPYKAGGSQRTIKRK